MSEFSSPIRQQRRRGSDGTTSALRAGVVLACAFGLWLVMDATVLQHNATVQSPLGARRTAALDILDPLSQLARTIRIDLPVGWSNVALGRTSVGGFVVGKVPTTTRPKEPTTTTTIERNPTRAHPLRVLLVGDSIGEDLDAPLLTDLINTGVATVFTDGKISSGLTREDYFPWISELEYDMYRYKPDIVIGMMGANDSQSFIAPRVIDFGTPQWREKYLRNVGQFFSIGRENGAKMFWVSVPVIANSGLNKEWNLVRHLQQKGASEHHVYYIDSDLTLAPNGHYAAYLLVSGQLAQVRISDGIHLTPAGGALLAQSVMVDLKKDLGLLHLHW